MAEGTAPRQPRRLRRREQIPAAQRVVIKVGSSSLTGAGHDLDLSAVQRIADASASLRARGAEVVLVSSGAIAAALGKLGLVERPRDVATQQAAASVGQALLAASWADAFGAHDLITGQVLLTESDVLRRETYRNVRTALEALLRLSTVPVVNENDTTATHEIRFGDNDRLAALIAQLLGADLLVLLTDVDSLRTAPPAEPGSARIPEVEDPSSLSGVSIGNVGSKVGTGGMVTKLAAASLASATGTAALLGSAQSCAQLFAGEDLGTFFPAREGGRRRSRMVWLRFATRGAGRLDVDEGAAAALRTGRRSLLAVGVTAVRGTFPAGVPVDIHSPDGELLARGLVEHSSEDLRLMLGRDTEQLRESLGTARVRPAVHRDHLVVM